MGLSLGFIQGPCRRLEFGREAPSCSRAIALRHRRKADLYMTYGWECMQSNIHLSKRLLVFVRNRYSKLRIFVIFLCMGMCKSLGSLKFFLRYTSKGVRSLLVHSTEHPPIVFILSLCVYCWTWPQGVTTSVLIDLAGEPQLVFCLQLAGTNLDPWLSLRSSLIERPAQFCLAQAFLTLAEQRIYFSGYLTMSSTCRTYSMEILLNQKLVRTLELGPGCKSMSLCISLDR